MAGFGRDVRVGRYLSLDGDGEFAQPRPPAGHAGRLRSSPFENVPILPGRGSPVNYYHYPAIQRLGTVTRGPFFRLRGHAPVAVPNPAAGAPLSESEISRYSVVDKYDGGKSSGTESTKACTICLEEFIDGVVRGKLGCSHVFHETCLVEWLKISPTCPQCRFNVRTGMNGEGN